MLGLRGGCFNRLGWIGTSKSSLEVEPDAQLMIWLIPQKWLDDTVAIAVGESERIYWQT